MLEEHEHDISELTLIPSRGGVFEVIVDDDLVYSKKKTGRHADVDQLLGRIRARGRS